MQQQAENLEKTTVFFFCWWVHFSFLHLRNNFNSDASMLSVRMHPQWLVLCPGALEKRYITLPSFSLTHTEHALPCPLATRRQMVAKQLEIKAMNSQGADTDFRLS